MPGSDFIGTTASAGLFTRCAKKPAIGPQTMATSILPAARSFSMISPGYCSGSALSIL
jgi:hypothetical protein